MDGSKRNRRIIRFVAAFAVVVATVGAFAALGGISLANSAIYRAQYVPIIPKHLSILKASAGRNGVVTVQVRITGWKMYPSLVGTPLKKNDGGHWTIFVDRRCNNVSVNRSSGKTKALRIGVHRIYAHLVNNDGSFLRPPIKSNTVTVTVVRTVKKKSYPAARICARARLARTASSISGQPRP
jgi:hypothetical protein